MEKLKISKTQNMVRSLIQGISKVNPKWAADLGLNAFLTPIRRRKPKRLPGGMQMRFQTINGKQVSIYRYGISLKKVLFVHGWEGAATDFTKFFEPLVENGFEVVAVDLPGHGQSRFSQLNAVMTAEIVADLEKDFGPFCAVVGHSFGAFSLGYALSKYEQFKGTPFVSIGSPTRLQTILSNFTHFVGLDSLQEQYLSAKIERNFNIKIHDFDQGQFMSAHQGPVMVVHDKNDGVVPVERLRDIQKITKSPIFHVTEGLGHNRILRDESVISKVCSFIEEHQQSRWNLESAIKYGI